MRRHRTCSTRTLAIAATATSCLGLLLLGCGPASPPAAAPKAPAPAKAPPAAEAPKPAPAAPAPTPVVSKGPHDPKAGEAIYAQYCASCHGARGGGDGPISASLTPKPAKHGDGSYMNPLSNEHLFKVVKEGGPSVGKSPMMAALGGSLSDEQIRDVVAFVRTLAEPPYTGPKP